MKAASPGVLRERTARNLRRARATYGDGHPATWAAYGRAIAAWGGSHRVREIAPVVNQLDVDLINIAATAGQRATRRPGFDNRRARSHRRAA